MKVFGQGRIIPPIRKAKNGDILFIAKGDRATIQVRATADRMSSFRDYLDNNMPIELSGELVSFNGRSGTHHVLILE